MTSGGFGEVLDHLQTHLSRRQFLRAESPVDRPITDDAHAAGFVLVRCDGKKTGARRTQGQEERHRDCEWNETHEHIRPARGLAAVRADLRTFGGVPSNRKGQRAATRRDAQRTQAGSQHTVGVRAGERPPPYTPARLRHDRGAPRGPAGPRARPARRPRGHAAPSRRPPRTDAGVRPVHGRPPALRTSTRARGPATSPPPRPPSRHCAAAAGRDRTPWPRAAAPLPSAAARAAAPRPARTGRRWRRWLVPRGA